MRDFRESKAMAHSLRQALSERAVTVTHSESLELIARSFGLDNWNILAAKIEAARPPEPLPADDGPKTLFCSFCGKSQHHVQNLIAGPEVFICDECVGLCDGVLVDQRIGKAIAEARARRPDAEPFAAEVEVLGAYGDAELLTSQRSATGWLEHIDWSLAQIEAALDGKPRTAWRPDERAVKRGWTRDPLAGKSREAILAQQADLQRQRAQVSQRLEAVRRILSERGIAG